MQNVCQQKIKQQKKENKTAMGTMQMDLSELHLLIFMGLEEKLGI